MCPAVVTCANVQRSPIACPVELPLRVEGGVGWGEAVGGPTVFVWDPVNQGLRENQTLTSKTVTATMCRVQPRSGRPAVWPSADGWSWAAPSDGQSPLSTSGGIFRLLSGCNSRGVQAEGAETGRGGAPCFDFLFPPNSFFFSPFFLSSATLVTVRRRKKNLRLMAMPHHKVERACERWQQQ